MMRAATSPKRLHSLDIPPAAEYSITRLQGYKYLPKRRATFHEVNTPEHPRHSPEDVQSVSDEIGYRIPIIYRLNGSVFRKGMRALCHYQRIESVVRDLPIFLFAGFLFSWFSRFGFGTPNYSVWKIGVLILIEINK